MKYREKVGDYLRIVSDSIIPSNYPSRQFHHYSIPAFDEKKEPRIEQGGQIGSSKTIVRPSTILVSKLNPRFRRVWKILRCPENSICSTEFIELAFKSNSDAKYIDFFTALFNTDHFMDYLSAVTIGTSSSHQRIIPKDILEYDFEQMSDKLKKEIGQIYGQIDDKISLNQQMNRTLESIAQAIFKHWFVNFEFPDENGKPYKSSGGKMVESELGGIPYGWRVGRFSEILDITSGKRPGKRADIKDIKFHVPLYGASSIMGYVREVLYSEPILIMGRVGTHGVIQRVKSPSFPSDNTLVIMPKFYEYVYQILRNIDYDLYNVGTTQPLITQRSIRNHEIIIPQRKTLELFEDLMTDFYTRIDENGIESGLLSQIRDSLLPKLMSGKIRVEA